jgi:hypothetical protein
LHSQIDVDHYQIIRSPSGNHQFISYEMVKALKMPIACAGQIQCEVYE